MAGSKRTPAQAKALYQIRELMAKHGITWQDIRDAERPSDWKARLAADYERAAALGRPDPRAN